MKHVAMAALVVVGCGGGNSVKGEIDGSPVAIQSGYFAQEDDVFENGDGLFVVVLSSLEDSCASDAQNSADAEEADDASDFGDAWKNNFPEDFWVVSLRLQVGDPEDPLDGALFDGVAWDELTSEDDEVTGTVVHFTSFLDEEYWDAKAFGGPAIDIEDYFDAWYTDGGDLEVTKHVANESLKGRFATEAATTDDGDTDGQIEVKFSVDRCTEMERYLFE